jgi:hypothetical protein
MNCEIKTKQATVSLSKSLIRHLHGGNEMMMIIIIYPVAPCGA